MISREKSLFVEEQLGRKCITILEYRNLEPCEVDLDSSLEFRKWPSEEVVVDQEGHLARSQMQLDDVGLVRVAIENSSAFDKHPKCRR